MRFARTALLLAGMTALFLAIGYAVAGTGGMIVALGGGGDEYVRLLEFRPSGAVHVRSQAG